MENKDTGLLLNKQNLSIHRKYFQEMVKLLGVQVIYKSPRKDKTYDKYGELDSNYYEPLLVGCIFEEHPTIWTMKKMGWNSELSESKSIIHVPYDLENLQSGALFIIPSGLDNTKGRVFKVLRMSTSLIYPASIACELGPVFESTFEKSNLEEFKVSDFNLLNEEKK